MPSFTPCLKPSVDPGGPATCTDPGGLPSPRITRLRARPTGLPQVSHEWLRSEFPADGAHILLHLGDGQCTTFRKHRLSRRHVCAAGSLDYLNANDFDGLRVLPLSGSVLWLILPRPVECFALGDSRRANLPRSRIQFRDEALAQLVIDFDRSGRAGCGERGRQHLYFAVMERVAHLGRGRRR